jgi:flagellar biosynthesis/type III secretory pathway chaperone
MKVGNIMVHQLRILPQDYKSIKEGSKTFELREYDRDFNIGDILVLKEYEETSGYTKREIIKEVSYLFKGGEKGLDKEFCILGLKNTLCVELKNIGENEATLINQLKKVEEENDEFETAIIKNDINNAIEEFWDKVQSSLGALEKIGIRAEIVIEDYPKHLEKIRNNS